MKRLHLVLKKQWFDMIASGEKTEEYRNCTEYWAKRVGYELRLMEEVIYENKYELVPTKKSKSFDCVCFHCGYTNITETRQFKGIRIGTGKQKWGAEKGKVYFVIKLGERIE
ncbi:MAG: hypothetical protein IJ759_00105 [Bacteroidales bacterium]|nr:hypothetical protein [Bacteroidales bacterium]